MPGFARPWSPKAPSSTAAPPCGLAGRVLEVGADNGLTFANYSPALTDVLAVAPEPYLHAQARGCMASR
jgi:hypothetical protein